MKIHRTAVVYHHLATALTNLALFGVVTWFAPMMIRVHGMQVADIGGLAGGSLMIGGLLGLVGGGWLGDRVSQKDPGGGKLSVCMGAVLLAAPCAIIFALTESVPLATLFWALAYTFGVAPIGNATAILQQLMPGPMRGLASALYLFVINIIGTGFGATVVALVTDAFFPASDGVRYSLAIVTPVVYLLAALCFWRASVHFRREPQFSTER
jgi:predicted MFS family arabinose efflux permease